MGTWQETHPWLTFRLDLARAPASLWVKLGECQSKCEHIAGVPLKAAAAQRLHRVYLAKGALATTAIEGNTLSEEQVRDHLQGKLRLPPSQEYLAKEIDNIVEACNGLLQQVADGRPPQITPQVLLDLHRTVMTGLQHQEDVLPGEFRPHNVGVARYRAPEAKHVPELVRKLCEWLGSDTFTSRPGMEIVYAAVKAVVAHLYIAWIHPFADGNGRTARLVEFLTLISSGVPSPAAQLLSNHYNQTRSEYYRQLDAAGKSGGDVLPFLSYAIQGFLDGLTEQLSVVRRQQLELAWRDYVHETLKGQSATTARRRHLVFDLTSRGGPVPVGGLRMLTPRLAAAYADKTPKTTTRDINALVKMGLVERTPEGVCALEDQMLAFLPTRARDCGD